MARKGNVLPEANGFKLCVEYLYINPCTQKSCDEFCDKKHGDQPERYSFCPTNDDCLCVFCCRKDCSDYS